MASEFWDNMLTIVAYSLPRTLAVLRIIYIYVCV